MSNYTMKTAALKSTILLSNIVLVGATTLISKRGINTNNIVADSIKNSDEDTYLTKSVADGLYGGSSLLYDWAPALELKIQFSLLEGESYTAPSNGWFVVNEKETNDGSVWVISVNQRSMFHSDNNGLLHVLVLVKMGDVITSNSNTSRNGYFMPCVSELRDWRVEELKSDADIWKNAVVHNADGTTTVRDQWLINLDDDNDTWGYVYGGAGITLGTTGSDREFQRTIHTIKEDEAFDLEGNHLFYVQTENILQGSSLFNNTSLTVFNGDLSSLTNGNKMFYYSALESFSGDLSSLTNGNMMFFNTSLTSFSNDMPSLTNGNQMFYQSALESFNGDLSSLTDCSKMFYGTALASFSGDLSSLTDGSEMFYQIPLQSFSGDLSSLTNCSNMFYNTALKSFSGDLSSLENGEFMFIGTPLESFNGDLSSLTNGYSMFYLTNLTSFDSDLPSLTDGGNMFYETALTSWNIDLPSLLKGNGMFRGTALTSFSGDLSSLTNGTQMFYKTALESFSGDLSSLTSGTSMFHSCKLNLKSIQNIANTIKTVSSGSITIGIQSSLRENADLTTALTTIGNKGWTVTTQYN